MSAVPICLYTIIYLGWVKSWYILDPLPGRLGAGLVYAFLPFGLAFAMLLLGVVFPGADPTKWSIWLDLFLVLGGIGVLFLIWRPSWVKPPWVRWLEREYGYGLHILLQEARATGRWRWEARVRTRLGLEDWAWEVLEKRREDMCWAWRDRVDWQVIRRMNREWEKRLATIEQYMIPYVPEHRKVDYEHYLNTRRESIKVNKELGYL
jgi:hypothetical protein